MEEIILAGRKLLLQAGEDPETLFLEMTGGEEVPQPPALLRQLGCSSFLYCAVVTDDWNRALSPWEAPPVFGKEPFGSGAEETLSFLLREALPFLRGTYRGEAVLGGYSLAGLFALYAASRTSAFSAVAAASPSVWFPGFLDYARAHPFYAKRASLSLGDKEAKTRNPLLSQVETCLLQMEELLKSRGVAVTLRMDPGGHFRDPDIRMAQTFFSSRDVPR